MPIGGSMPGLGPPASPARLAGRSCHRNATSFLFSSLLLSSLELSNTQVYALLGEEAAIETRAQAAGCINCSTVEVFAYDRAGSWLETALLGEAIPPGPLPTTLLF